MSFENLKAGIPINLTASGALTTGRGCLLGFYVAVQGGTGTVVIKDGGSGGTALTGTITPAVGWHFLPLQGVSSSGLYATLANTPNITFIVMPEV